MFTRLQEETGAYTKQDYLVYHNKLWQVSASQGEPLLLFLLLQLFVVNLMNLNLIFLYPLYILSTRPKSISKISRYYLPSFVWIPNRGFLLHVQEFLVFFISQSP